MRLILRGFWLGISAWAYSSRSGLIDVPDLDDMVFTMCPLVV